MAETRLSRTSVFVLASLSYKRFGFVLIVALLPGFISAGCLSRGDRLADGRKAFLMGNLTEAKHIFSEVAAKDKCYREVAKMDLAMVELAAGNPQATEKLLRQARNHFDAQPKTDTVASLASWITDDTYLPYQAAGYEQVMLRTLLALSSLMGDRIDAESYALQAQMKQTELHQSAQRRNLVTSSSPFQPVAFAPYLQGLLRESTHQNYNDAKRAYQLVQQWRPKFSLASADIHRASTGTHSQPGNGVLYVFACIGRGPIRRETTVPATKDVLNLVVSGLNHTSNSKTVTIPRIVDVAIPEVVVPLSSACNIGITVGDSSAYQTESLTDVAELAISQMSAERPWIIAKAIARRIAKEAATMSAGKALDLDGTNKELFSFVVGTIWQSTEQADLRCWGLLPREIQVTRIELPAGTHPMAMDVLDANATPLLGPSQRGRITINDGETHFLTVFAPAQRILSVIGLDSD